MAALSVALGCALALPVAGCGASDDYTNREKPPAPIVVSASIDNDRVQVSPRRFGAGPIELVITNQSTAAQQVTLETSGSATGARPVQTGPINPRETASVSAEVASGSYALRVGGKDVRAARLTVGEPRPSAQNELLQP